ncbi:site-specific DNA-methyltransferase [Helicobacter muridarum]|uniref:Modification methylase MjaII n=1 Tax=Helicobacter muridarum TaxID=216 RepID=A0A377PUZ2_9HELI|nr:DNA methyltransferase [Helicobacter muridarum]TLE01683.1 site-specific DNA-methyltransferase [Helicobacter muridarum]STQ86320.1 modification methylase MjaII [Helicobacter muridarum]
MTQTLVNNGDFIQEKFLLTPKQASIWASEYLNKKVTSNNIIYLLNYGKIANHSTDSKINLIDKNELKTYYDNTIKSQKHLDSPLSFAQYKEAQTTKHIHRIHPYKGKFIPQLVEYFLDSHIDSIKLESCFKKGDIVLDIFAGSGTTLCVANEPGMHSVGVELSSFNTMLCNAKITKYDLKTLETELNRLTKILESYNKNSPIIPFETELNNALSAFNQIHFPNKTFKRQVTLKQIDENHYGKAKQEEFLVIYDALLAKHSIKINIKNQGSFLEKWYIEPIRKELILLKNEIVKADKNLQDILCIILSRTARSVRATTHRDLATLLEPITTTYYCKKHGRICKPLFSISKWWKAYAKDTLKRLKEFQALRSDSYTLCLNADSTNVDIVLEIQKQDKTFANLIKSEKIAGIFSSPPYVGLIDYHEQHAYAYDIFDLPRKDNLEIGKLSEGQSKSAQETYTQGIAQALKNAKRFLKEDYNVFLVANDKFNLYPKIAELAGMQIVKKYDRPVLNRSEKDKNRYNESIFHLRERNNNE